MAAEGGTRAVIAMALEGYALRTAVREANRTLGTRDWFQFVRRARSPELPVLLLEDSGALVGLTLALLGAGLSVLGEAALPEKINTIHAAMLATPGVEQVIHLRTVHLGPDDLLVAARIGVEAAAEGDDIAATIDAAEVCPRITGVVDAGSVL